VVVLGPAVTTEVVLVVEAATKTTARGIATTRGTQWCLAVVEATVPVLATLKAAAKVPPKIPATCSGNTEGPAMKIGTTMFPGDQACKGKKRVPTVAGKPSFLSHLSLFFSLRPTR
jgi:hypothetical protein